VVFLLLLYLAPFVMAAAVVLIRGGAGRGGVLRRDGRAAYQRGDYSRAAELLRRSAAADPAAESAFSELGWALVATGRLEEARQAFSRQIEVNPTHPNAYIGRAMALDRLGRPGEAENDLLTQVNVAPSSVDALAVLGRRRLWQRRPGEAVSYFERAAALDPRNPSRWVDLGWARLLEGKPTAARSALQYAESFGLPESLKVRAGVAYGALGAPADAGRLAAEAVPVLERQLAKISAESYSANDLATVASLAQGWQIIGASALVAGDTVKAERYFAAAWKRGFVPAAAWSLGLLRERQGRTAQALDLWQMALLVPTGSWNPPADALSRINSTARRLGVSVARPAGDRLTALRTLRIAGPLAENKTERVLLLAGPQGELEHLRSLSGANSQTMELLLRHRSAVGFDFPRPDDAAIRTVHTALLVCSATTACSVVLDLPGQ
jgi:tetratricopeptide (TPR) repeat protein